VLHGSPASGSVTSDNLKTLNYSAFETGPLVDDKFPAINDIHAVIDPSTIPTQSIVVYFTEDVSQSLTGYSLTLNNLSTAQLIPGNAIAVAWDAGTNSATFSFPGVLPDGIYQAILAASAVSDLAGNPTQSSSEIDFAIGSPPDASGFSAAVDSTYTFAGFAGAESLSLTASALTFAADISV